MFEPFPDPVRVPSKGLFWPFLPKQDAAEDASAVHARSKRQPFMAHAHGPEEHHEDFGKAMIAGAVAGTSEHICMFPVDTIKTRLQAQTAGALRYNGVIHCANEIIRKEGVARLYRGLPAVAVGAIPSHAIHFAVYEWSKHRLGIDDHDLDVNPFKFALAGSLAVVSHDAIITPLDVIKQRLQVFNSPHKGVMDTAKSIISKEGLSAFYASYPTTVALNVPFMTVHFVVYESLKRALSKPDGSHGPLQESVAGGMAGAMGGLVSNPLDIWKTRIQLEGATAASARRRPITIFKHLLAEEGVSGLFRGVQARVLYFTPSAAICWTVYETMKRVLDL